MNKFTRRGRDFLRKNGGTVPTIGAQGAPEQAGINVGELQGPEGAAVGLRYGAVTLALDPDTADGIADLLRGVAKKIRADKAAARLKAVPADVGLPQAVVHECPHPATTGSNPPRCTACGVRMASPVTGPACECAHRACTAAAHSEPCTGACGCPACRDTFSNAYAAASQPPAVEGNPGHDVYVEECTCAANQCINRSLKRPCAGRCGCTVCKG